MKISFFSVLFLLLSLSFSQETSKPSLIQIAVIDLEAQGINDFEAKTLTSKLRSSLLQTKKYQVIERGQMNEILKEQGFQNSGCTSSECMVEMGQLIGVEKIVAGTVGKVGSLFLISIRIIDVATGNIDKMADKEISGGIEKVLSNGIPAIVAEISNTSISLPASHPTPNTSTKAPSQKNESSVFALSINIVSMFFEINYIEIEKSFNQNSSINFIGGSLDFTYHWSDSYGYGTDLTKGYFGILSFRHYFATDLKHLFVGAGMMFGPVENTQYEYDNSKILISQKKQKGNVVGINILAGYRLKFYSFFSDLGINISANTTTGVANSESLTPVPLLSLGYAF